MSASSQRAKTHCPRNHEYTAENTTYSRGGRSRHCRTCANTRRRGQYQDTSRRAPDDIRRRRLWSMYRLTPEHYDSLLAEQGGRCAVCRRTPEENTHGRLFVDHCHVTHRVRGLLCSPCNTALGLLADDAQRIERLAAYARTA